MGRSVAARRPRRRRRRLHASRSRRRRSATASYADDLLTTLRRTPTPSPATRSRSCTRARPARRWSRPARGTRSACAARARPASSSGPRSAAEQVLPRRSRAIATETMVPVSHLLWSHLWLGIATDAFDRARAFVRAAARRAPGEPVAGRASSSSHVMTRAVAAARRGRAARWTSSSTADEDRERLSTMAFALHFNNLKLAASEQAPRVCQGAMGVCGIVGFKNDTPFSVGRHLRDSMSACADGGQRADPPDQRRPAADRQGGLGHGRVPRRRTAEQAELLDALVDAGLPDPVAASPASTAAAATSRTSALRFDAYVTRVAAAADERRRSCASRRCCRASRSRTSATWRTSRTWPARSSPSRAPRRQARAMAETRRRATRTGASTSA